MMTDGHVQDLVRHLLAGSEFTGRNELLAQVTRLRVVGGPVIMLNLAVDFRFGPLPRPEGPIPGVDDVYDDSGQSVGTLLLWVSAGYLSALEFAWWTDAIPQHLPLPSDVRRQPAGSKR